MPRAPSASARFLDRPDGRIAYDDSGAGPLVIMAPGFGDTKEEYRFLAPKLVAAGYRAVAMDLRGHGQSSTGWDDHTCAAMGRDMLALIEHLDAGPADLSARRFRRARPHGRRPKSPAAIAGLVLIGPFARNVPIAWWKAALFKTIMHTMFTGPWAPAAWGAYYASLYPSAKPADFDAYKSALVANLKEPGRMAALQAMMRVDRSDVEPRLGDVRAPTLVVMGSKDPDFDSPAAEAANTGRTAPRQRRHDRRRRTLSPRRDAREDGAGHRRLPRRHGETLMPRAGLTTDAVLDAASDLADKEGLANVTLAALAARFGVRPPSLYKHVDGLDAIHRGLAVRGLREAVARCQRATVGKARDEALFAFAHAYWQFARERPGLYAASVRAAKPGENDIAAAGEALIGIVLSVLAGYGVTGDDALHATRGCAPSSTASSRSTPWAASG